MSDPVSTVPGRSDPVTDALAGVARALPGGGEARAGQTTMAQAVAEAIKGRRNVVVQAGTGTGKSLAYLVPAVLADEKVVVATATKALQDQLAGKDLPLLADTLRQDLTFAVLKGRSNYLCRQRISELGGQGDRLALGDDAAGPLDADDPLGDRDQSSTGATTRLEAQVQRLVQWSDDTTTGDRAELEFEPHFRAWAMVSTTARECPGAFRCPSGRDCFAEDARERAAAADVVVVNTHLYAAHVASGGAVLPEHDIVVFDEAHEVEDVMTDSLGVEIGAGRFRALAAVARGALDTRASRRAAAAADQVAEIGEELTRALLPFVGRRIPPTELVTSRSAAADPRGPEEGPGTMPLAGAGDVAADRPDDAPDRSLAGTPAGGASNSPELGPVVALAGTRVRRLVDLLRQAERDAPDGEDTAAVARRDRALRSAGSLADDLVRLDELTDDDVAWVDGGNRAPSLRVSPVDVGPILAEQLWGGVTAVLTSATVPIGLVSRLGLPEERTDELDVGSPFDYREHAMLYVAGSLPDRRRPEAEPAIADELVALISAAGGRTLALFTSWRAMTIATDNVRPRVPFTVFAQGDLPKPALVEAFRSEEASCLFATLGFWQGVDVPGPTLSLVTIDRIPFPRPDDPVLQARRDRAGPGAFGTIDLPRAGTLLAQGAGRLIRSAGDRGVVAVLDSRLATASYRRALLARVPPMRRSLDRAATEAFLRLVTADHPG